MSHRKPIPLLLAVLACSPSPSATAGDEIADDIAGFLGPRTIVVGHVDVTKVDVGGFLDLVEMSGETIPEEGRMQAEAFVRSFVAAGASDVFALLSWDDLPLPEPVLVVPAEKGGAVEALVNLLPRREGHVVESIRGAVVSGPKDAVARLRMLEPTQRPDIVAAVASTGAAPARIVVASGPEERRAMRALLPTFPPPVGKRFRDLFAEPEWYAFSADLTPAAFRVVAALPNDDLAERMHALQTDILEHLRESTFSRRVPDLSRTAAALSSERDGRRVVLALAPAKVRDFVESLQPAAERERRALTRSGPGRSLKQIGLAFHNFAVPARADENVSTLPARASFDADGTPLLSWRVHILPFLGEKTLYEQFHLDEPWDSPHNKTLLPKMPNLYAGPDGRPGMTHYVVPVGEGTMFEGTNGVAFREITDGTAVTILAVVGTSPVPWTKPADWAVDLENPTAGLFARNADDFLVLFADGSVRRWPADVEPKNLRSLLTMAGGERIVLDDDRLVFPE